jgi:D-cysteine desulfhydrase
MIRGEELAARPLNPTLQTAQQFGMQLRFISREQYRQKHTAEFLAQLRADYPEHYVIPEGGTNALAVQGCREILTENDLNNFDLICCAAGTGGTIAGLIEASRPRQRILGFSALKGLFLNDEVAKLTAKTNWEIIDDYCCGGYAKTTPELLQFIRLFEAEHSLPLEQIYTGKMLFGISQMIQRGEIASDQRVLIIHSGGLQGKLQK